MDGFPHIDRFLNDPQLIAFQEGRRLSRSQLVNTLNYINFQDGTILANFRHRKYHQVISIKVRPLPSLDDTLECLWADPSGIPSPISALDLMHLIISDGLKLILVQAEARQTDERGIVMSLPESCYEISARRMRRYACTGIEAHVLQKSSVFYGRLVDFSAASFSIDLSSEAHQSFRWIDREDPVHAILRSPREVIYSGECVILRQASAHGLMTVALAPVHSHLRRVAAKEFRCTRHELRPAPAFVFTHPLTGRVVTLRTENVSSTGFAVEEYNENSVLLPGMIIPDASLELSDGTSLKVKVQVMYRNLCRNDADRMIARCGCMVLDMELQDQMRLASLLHQAINRKSFVCAPVDLDQLWKFFFDAGFVYPKKYAFMHANKASFRDTYEKLYLNSPAISRHFTFQDRGVLLGHMSMIRSHEKTWLIHHHAARKSGGRAGLVVLDQVGYYVNEFHTLNSTNMDFVMCYFRPDNKFPSRVFGGVARDIGNPKGSSLDSFAYFHIPRSHGGMPPLSPVQFAPAGKEDMAELARFYEFTSGGLMLNALDLTPSTYDRSDLDRTYAACGFSRSRRVYSLRREGILCALMTVTVSDVGLNLSGLVHCIHVFVLEPELLLRDQLYGALSSMSQSYQDSEVPVLLYPASYAEAESIPFEKNYTLWVLNMLNSDDYFRSLQGLFRKAAHA